MGRQITISIFSLYFLQLFFSCKKDSVSSNNTNHSQPVMSLTGVKPDAGKHGDTILITGTHFNLNASFDSVKFNGKTAVIQKVTADTLFVTVPLGAGSGTVTVNGLTVPGPTFSYVPVVMVSTFSGGTPGYLDGPDSLARFNDPLALCVDSLGNMYVDDGNYLIRKISEGLVSTFAGNGISGYVNGPDSLAEFFSRPGWPQTRMGMFM